MTVPHLPRKLDLLIRSAADLRVFCKKANKRKLRGWWVPQGWSTCFAVCSMPPSKRSPWETSPGGAGLYLADLGELTLPDEYGADEIESIPIDEASPTSIGYALIITKKATDFASLRTAGCFFLVTKGFIQAQLVQKGFSSDRVFTATLSLADGLVGSQEPRAVTIVNCGQHQVDWVSEAEPMTEVEISCIQRFPVFAELRQSQAREQDWTDLSGSDRFEEYIRQTLVACKCFDQSILHKTFERQGYIARRVMVPVEARDALYHRSGLQSIQFRPIRQPDDPPEQGLELLKMSSDLSLADLATKHRAQAGNLGFFQTGKAIYFRSTDQELVNNRKFFYKNDPKWIDSNWATKALHNFKVMGFPSGITSREVSLTFKELGVDVIPLQQYHFKELSMIYVATDTEPVHWKFSTSVGNIHLSRPEARKQVPKEIRQQSVKGPAPAKPQVLPRQPSVPKSPKEWITPQQVSPASSTAPSTSSSSAPSTSLSSRVTSLEKRLGILETNQTSLSDRMDKGFHDLLTAISGLQGASQSGTPVKSPARKAPKV